MRRRRRPSSGPGYSGANGCERQDDRPLLLVDLEDSYGAERGDLDARHIREFAQPSRAETPQALSERQEGERRELESRYQAARQGGMTRMPAPAAPRGGGRPR
jgi:hypothetical protein